MKQQKKLEEQQKKLEEENRKNKEYFMETNEYKIMKLEAKLEGNELTFDDDTNFYNLYTSTDKNTIEDLKYELGELRSDLQHIKDIVYRPPQHIVNSWNQFGNY